MYRRVCKTNGQLSKLVQIKRTSKHQLIEEIKHCQYLRNLLMPLPDPSFFSFPGGNQNPYFSVNCFLALHHNLTI